VDITKLEGYKPEMTDTEKLALIQKYEPPTPDYTGYVKKDVFDKTASDAADWKKKYNGKLTEDEQKEAERAAKEAEKDALLETLKKDKAISESKAKFLGLGYDEKLAAETATAFANGDYETVFKNQGIHLENVKKATTAAALANDPKPPAGAGALTPGAIDYPKAIAEAQANSDFGLAAMLMRQQQEAIMKKT
jgi:hypothetical protein